MSLGEHLEELRQRLWRAVIGLGLAVAATVWFGQELIELLKWPYVRVMHQLGRPAELQVLGATEGVTIFLQVGLVAGLILAAPWVGYQLWMFIAAGLHEPERRAVRRVVPFSAGLFVGGAMFYLFVVSVPMMHFFISFNEYLGLVNDFTLANHIRMTLVMMLVFGLSFQLPLVVAVLGLLGVVSVETLSRYRRHVIVGLLIFAALMTSPSPVDQVLLAVPMWLLFELGVLLVWFGRRRSTRAEAQAEDESS